MDMLDTRSDCQVERFQRSVTQMERAWLGIDRISPPFAIQLVLEGHGRINLDCLQAAVAKASQVNPGSSLVLKGALRHSHWLDSGRPPLVSKVEGGAWDGHHPANAPFLARNLPYSGPTCEVLLVEGVLPRLIFRANHAVMDARGICTWAEDVFRVMNAKEPYGARSTETEKSIMAHCTDQIRRVGADECIAPTGRSQPSAPGATWERLTLAGSLAKAIGKIGYSLAQSAWRYDDGIVRLVIPVDLRPRKPGLRSTGNLTSFLYIDVTKDSTPDTITYDMWRQLYRKRDCMRFVGGVSFDLIPITLLGIGIKIISKLNHRNGLYNASALISNVGRIDTKMFCGGGFHTDTIFMIPPNVDRMPVSIVLVESMGRQEITVSVPNDLATDNRFDCLLEDICRALDPEALQEPISVCNPAIFQRGKATTSRFNTHP